ncbi:MAG TPA: transcription elongation factor GreB [Myxococcota bacterium]|jgi:transcription elongation factor GreB
MGSYITPEGFRRLQEEAERLWRVERPRVTAQVADAAALGDRSENAEYIYGKKRLREIDGRLRFLQQKLDSLTIVSEPPARRDRIYFGAFVTVEEESGEGVEYRLVGPDESDPSRGLLSIESPLGRALMGKGEGDEVTVRRPRGDAAVVIAAIRYEG